MQYKKSRPEIKSISDVVKANSGCEDTEYLLGNTCPEPYIYNLDKAAEYIANNRSKKITIVGDYDCDGICASSILYRTLNAGGYNVRIRIPKRLTEGYGISDTVIKEISDGIVLTVDNGIAALDVIKAAKKKGLTVIVVDHHEPAVDEAGKMVLPEADIIVDAHTEEKSEYKDYCGAGLAYRLSLEIIKKSGFWYDVTKIKVLAAIATVADMVNLPGANHKLVKEGLKLINQGTVPEGIKKMMMLLEQYEIDESQIGFILGPTINAAGRLRNEGADLAVKILCTDDVNIEDVAELVKLNEERKTETANEMKIISEHLNEEPDDALIIFHPCFKEGLCGLVAGKLSERYKVPAIVLAETKDGFLKGSARGVEGVDIKAALDKCAGLLVKHGGHAQAAGVTLKKSDLVEFRKKFRECLHFEPLAEKAQVYDLEVATEDLDAVIPKIRTQLDRYAPYGMGNPRPIFRITATLSDCKAIGEEKNHLRGKTGNLGIIGFDLWEDYAKEGAPVKVDMIGTLGVNRWKSRVSDQFEITAIRKAED